MIHLLSLFGILPENFLPYNESIFCFIGASLFSVYLAYHTRLIVSGKYTKYQMNRKDDAFGAMLLYNDIINIFLYILRLLGDRRDWQRWLEEYFIKIHIKIMVSSLSGFVILFG